MVVIIIKKIGILKIRDKFKNQVINIIYNKIHDNM